MILGRRKRRVVKIVKRQLPTIFNCPNCGEEAVKVTKSSSGMTTIQCGGCGLKDEFQIPPSSKMIDAYCKFTDRYLAGEIEAPSS